MCYLSTDKMFPHSAELICHFRVGNYQENIISNSQETESQITPKKRISCYLTGFRPIWTVITDSRCTNHRKKICPFEHFSTPQCALKTWCVGPSWLAIPRFSNHAIIHLYPTLPWHRAFGPTQDDQWCRSWLPTEMVVSRIKTFVPAHNCHIQEPFCEKKRHLRLCQNTRFWTSAKEGNPFWLRLKSFQKQNFADGSISSLLNYIVNSMGALPQHIFT